MPVSQAENPFFPVRIRIRTDIERYGVSTSIRYGVSSLISYTTYSLLRTESIHRSYHFNYPERSLTMEEMLNKFIDEGKQEHEELRAFIYDFQTTNELLFKERNNSLIELIFGVQELLKVINKVPMIDCNVIGVTNRGGKTTTQDVHDNNTNVLPKEPLVAELEKPVESSNVLANNQPQMTSEPIVQPSNEQLHINLPFIKALAQMPKYAKFLKGLLNNKDKLEEDCKIIINERCSAVLLNKLPSKEKDPGSFTIPCDIGQLHIDNALADLGTIITLMPYTMYKKFGLREPKATRMNLECCESASSNGNNVSKNSIWRIDSANMLYPVTQGTTKCDDVKSEHLYSASANKIDEKKQELKNLPQHLEYLLGGGNEYYCFIDGFLGFFQIPIALEDQEKTTFTYPYGTFAYRQMLFGLCNAPATFQRCMTAIFHDMVEDFMEVFMDDFSVFVYTDHSALKYLFNKEDAKPRLIRLENPDLGTFIEEEITDAFPNEHLMILKAELNNDEPWCDACQRSRNKSSRSEMPQNNIQTKVTNRAIKHILERSVGYNPKNWSKKLNDALWAFKSAYKTPTGCNPFQIGLWKSLSPTYGDQTKSILDEAYENTQIYKERTKRWHDSRLRGDKDFKAGYKVNEARDYFMSSASTVTYTSVYTDFEPGKVFWGADDELSDGAPPSLDYVPRLEHPPSPDYVPGPEHPPSPVEVPYVPKPEYLRYLVPFDEEAPMEDQSLPTDASPTALSPGYVADSDPDEDPKEDHADYPSNEGDDNGEPCDNEEDDDDTDDEDEEVFDDEEAFEDYEKEEHLAPADSSTVPAIDPVPLVKDTEAFKTDESAPPPRSPQTKIPSPPLPPLPSSLHLPPPVPISLLLPLLPLPPLPALLFIPPTIDRKEDIFKAELPTHKRLCLTAPTSRYELGESLTTAPRPTGGRRTDYVFIGTMDDEIRRQRVEEVDYGIRDVWVDLTEAIKEVEPTTLEGVNARVTELAAVQEQDTHDIYAVIKDA
ncbi:reverse transcriptase domain-containing protein [Tanacetum coccineum]